MPAKPSGRMPTIVSGTSLTVSDPPGIDGSAASFRRHSRSAISATGSAPAAETQRAERVTNVAGEGIHQM
jgi:hypothetical protein